MGIGESILNGMVAIGNALADASENTYTEDEISILKAAREIAYKHNKGACVRELDDILNASNRSYSCSYQPTINRHSSDLSPYEIRRNLINGVCQHGGKISVASNDVLSYKNTVYTKIKADRNSIKVMMSPMWGEIYSSLMDWSRPTRTGLLITAVYNGSRWSITSVTTRSTFSPSTTIAYGEMQKLRGIFEEEISKLG